MVMWFLEEAAFPQIIIARANTVMEQHIVIQEIHASVCLDIYTTLQENAKAVIFIAI